MRSSAKKDGNWQPSCILAVILKFFYLTARHSKQNCSLDPYLQIGTENKNFCMNLKWNLKNTLAPHPTSSVRCACMSWNPSFIRVRAFIRDNIGLITVLLHRFYVNIKLLILIQAESSCVIMKFCSTRCPAECGIFGERTTHVVLKTQQLNLTEL